MPKKLHRRPPKQEPLATILIACEGSKTEQLYFDGIRQDRRLSAVRIELVGHRGTDPKSVVEAAIAKRKELQQDQRWQKGDQAWTVFDEDGHSAHPSWPNVIQQAKQQRVNLAITNPCFELWYLLHFQDQFASITCAKADKRLNQHIPDYDKARCYYPNPLNALTTQAVKRAEDLARQIDRDDVSEYANPSCSQLSTLVQTLLNLNR